MVVLPGLQLIQIPSGPRISSIVSSSTFTKPMGCTFGRILLLKPHDPTYNRKSSELWGSKDICPT